MYREEEDDDNDDCSMDFKFFVKQVHLLRIYNHCRKKYDDCMFLLLK